LYSVLLPGASEKMDARDVAMKILTASEMSAADKRSVEMGVPVWTLMKNAGAAVARFSLRQFAGDGLVVVVCGKGNNGGDGMVAAVEMADAGRKVRVALLGRGDELKGEAERAFYLTKICKAADGTAAIDLREIADEAALSEALEGAELVLDAVVGTGFKPPLRGLAASARDLIVKCSASVVAVDVPSGWDADSMAMEAEGAFRADAVVTFTAPKLAHVFGQMTERGAFGPVVVVPIGTPAKAIEAKSGLHWAGAAKAIAEEPRAMDGNKGRFGHVLIVGGSFGKAGAPSMASLAALRAGAGLVTAAVPKEIVPTVAAVAPELMLQALEGGVDSLVKGMTVVGIGPGLGQEGETPEFVREFVRRVELPMVIDADGLNAFAGKTELLKQAAQGRTIVLTPHPGEMARLVGMTVKEVEANRVGLARRFATAHGVTLVLKGWRTLVAHPDGSVAVNTTGNPSMAKGGSGDILTGIVAAMLAQYKENVAEVVEAAVFLHGLAGDFACRAQDEHTVLATDTVGHLADAFRARVTDADGLTWLCGLPCGLAGARA
jgi:NAD(P)H-hydrate epimerase